MKRSLSITAKDLNSAGFIEVKPGQFVHHSKITNLKFHQAGFTPVKIKRKKGGKTAAKKIDLFILLVEKELNVSLIPEYKFYEGRKWRMDYALPESKLFIEVEGGVFTNGRHTRGKGFMNDMEKYNTAAAMGWKMIRRVPGNLMSNETIVLIKQTLNQI